MKNSATEAQTQRRSKYRAIRTNGFASKREANAAAILQAVEQGGTIRNLRFQVKYELLPKDEMGRAISYIADFVYDELVDGKWCAVVADAKGFSAPVYVLKKRLMFSKYGIKIHEL